MSSPSLSEKPGRARHPLGVLVVGLALLFVGVWQAPQALSPVGLASYLPLHTFLETVSIVVATMIFGVAWNAYSAQRSGNTMILACAFLAIGLIDFAHMLSFAGMPELVTPSDPEKAINFWLASRLLAACTLLVVALRRPGPLRSPTTRYVLLAGGLTIVLLVYWIGLFRADLLPRTFIPGEGLTTLKIGAEWAIVGILAVSGLLHFRARERSSTSGLLAVASTVAILSELSFTLYSEVHDAFNLLGHVYKVIVDLLLYRAIFVTSVQEPFEQLIEAGRETERARRDWNETFDAVRDLIFLHDEQYRIVRANRAYLQAAGVMPSAAIGKRYWEIFPRGDGPVPGCSGVLNGEVTEGFEQDCRIEGSDGELIYRSRGYLVREAGGRARLLMHVMEDITGTRRAEQELARSKELLERVFSAVHVLVAYLDRDFNFIKVNRAYAAAEGKVPEFFFGKNHFDLYPDAENERIFRQVLATGEPYVAIERPFTSAGRPGPAYWDWRLEPVHGPESRIEGLVLTLLDVTHRVLAAQSLRESEEKFRAIADSAQDAVILIDDRAQVMFWNAAAERAMGYSAAQAQGRNVHELIVPERYRDDCARGMAQFRALGTGPVIGKMLELHARHRDGREIPIELSVSAIQLHGRWHAIALLRDITERRITEGMRRELAAIVQSSSEAIIGKTLQGVITSWNRGAEKVYGYAPEEIVGRHVCVLAPEDKEQETAQLMQRVAAGETILGFETERVRKGGARIDVSLTLSPILDGAGKVAGVSTVASDITERKCAERALQRVNRALKTLSAGNTALVRANDEAQLLRQMCAAIVEVGGYRIAWVGAPQHDEAKTVRVVAQAGYAEGAMERAQITWDDVPAGRGPVGLAIRGGEVQTVQDTETDERFALWRNSARALGYRSVFVSPLRQDGSVAGVLNIYAAEPNAFDPEEVRLLSELAGDLAFGLAMLRIRRLHASSEQRLREGMLDTIEAIAATVEQRDPYTAGHQRRVAQLAEAIARELALPGHRIEGLRLGATIHDIGKIYIPAEILARPGRLSAPELALIKSHSQVGYDIIKGIDFPWPIATMILQHHERLDGSGYPNGATGAAIVLEARILSVADVVEAMASHRPYRPGLGIGAALKEIEEKRGRAFDTQVVDACIKLFTQAQFRWD